MSAGASQSTASATADAAEVNKFHALSHKFWDPHGEFKPLHILNPVRARFVAERAQLRGARVLDVGCGGGLLCEALVQAGAQVTGIDLAEGMIEVAKLHAAEQSLSIDYRVADAESLAATEAGTFDVMTCMEMLEHVPAPQATLATLARLVRPGGSVFISTISRNLKSFLLAIVGAEYVMNLVPRGTHEYERLIRPSELAAWGRAAGLSLMDLAGLDFNPFTETCRLTRDPSINYLVHFERTGPAS
ncbi:MAG TPA: bifunctional 2-polyprenyl-6-hydroxyphenol methylase/3-demethylubiquinol 3-O-methyltransferase UbiG [Steroidobacteraceae bacterium]|nr:bifunctional 2-polyprenyl-6-hydroxyphenol methylase/3-demethylubiquinol 3-O-methyltransferase UbiG [Steroidobacteraceae bacterium]